MTPGRYCIISPELGPPLVRGAAVFARVAYPSSADDELMADMLMAIVATSLWRRLDECPDLESEYCRIFPAFMEAVPKPTFRVLDRLPRLLRDRQIAAYM